MVDGVGHLFTVRFVGAGAGEGRSFKAACLDVTESN